jgi:leucyl-tRNA synthetase
MERYEPTKIEAKWRRRWTEAGLYEVDLEKAENPYYNLMMFPYPSAGGLHVGNMYAFTGADVWGRFVRMRGKDVLEPIGLDGFGIHSENFAIKIGAHPMRLAKKTEKHFYDQLRKIGNGFAWSRKLETYDPAYYRWTQWIFVQMFKKGLAYRRKADVNWCPSCKTVLADEQVIEGRCERCDSEVERKKLAQWFFRITDYADRLLDNLEGLNWSKKVKVAQRHWIGRSEGAEIAWRIEGGEETVWTFTTRLDTIFGATFLVVAPDHPLLERLSLDEAAQEYRRQALKKNEQKRKAAEKEKTGVDTGLRAIHPLTGEKIPIWIADFVLMEYGTGAIMGVPAHDERDFEFAVKYDLPIIQVVKSEESVLIGYVRREWSRDFERFLEDLASTTVSYLEKSPNAVLYLIRTDDLEKWFKIAAANLQKGSWYDLVGDKYYLIWPDGTRHEVEKYRDDPELLRRQQELEKSLRVYHRLWEMLFHSPYAGFVCNSADGRIINSGDFDGLTSREAREKILKKLEDKGEGRRKTTYHLRDWLISRQRYWGPPIPMIYCSRCAAEGRSWFSGAGADVGEAVDKIGEREAGRAAWAAGWYPVSEDDLPVELPYLENFKPAGTGQAPLAQLEDWVRVDCPGCGREARRETEVSDTFLDSAWYFLRYPSVDDEKEIWEKERTAKWLPVDSYIGGAEHSVLHLLYARFLTMVFSDWGLISFEEPFSRFYAHGLLIREGAKMSKSKGNVIIPDEYIERFGADTFRTYLMFLGPFDRGGDFRDTGIAGTHKFIRRVWKLVNEAIGNEDLVSVSPAPPDPERRRRLHRTIREVTGDLERLRYNTAIAKIRLYVNQLEGYEALSTQEIEVLLKLLAPFAPFVTEELWQRLGKKTSIHKGPWPEFDARIAISDQVTIVVQVDGKLRGTFEAKRGSEEKTLVEKARQLERVKKYLGERKVKRVVTVPDKLINFVTSPAAP